MDVTLQPGSDFRLEVSSEHSAIAYLFEGAGYFGADHDVESRPVDAVRMIVFGDGDEIEVRAAADSHARFMLIAGAPIREPIVPYGPFVMNTEQEIRQALDDLRSGNFVKN